MNTLKNSPGKWISMLYRHAQSFISKRLREYNIGSGQYMFLMELYKGDGRKQEDLVNTLNIDKGTTARALANLEKQGYLRREVDEADKRAYRVYLTQKAFDVKPHIHQVLSEWNNIITSSLSDMEAKTAVELIQKMAANAITSVDRNQ